MNKTLVIFKLIKEKNAKIFLASLILCFGLTLSSCVKKINDGPCEIVSDYYFIGNIFEEQICMNDGKNGVGVFAGFYPSDSDYPEYGTYRFGLDTDPVFRFDTWITVVTPKIGKKDFDYIWQIFEPGIKFFSDPDSPGDQEFELEYTIINSVMGTVPSLMSYYYTVLGDQTGSTLNILEREEIESENPDTRDIRVKMLVNCKIYGLDGNFQQELTDIESQLLISIIK